MSILADDRPSLRLPVPVAFADFAELRRLAAAKAGEREDLDDLLARALGRTGEVVAAAAGRAVKLEVFPGSEDAWCVPDGSVHVGDRLLRMLDDACLQLAVHLVYELVHRTASMGPAVPLPILEAARHFPDAALDLHDPHMRPGAVDPTGRPWSDFDSVTAALRRLRAGRSRNLGELRAMHGNLSRLPTLGHRRPQDGAAVHLLSGEPLPHLLLLYGKILNDALALVVAHEVAHVALGHHLDDAPSAARLREDEVAADREAAAWLAASDAFDLRSAALLFSFLAQFDETRPLDRISHPVARDRMGVLVAAMSSRAPARVIADVNVAFRLLRSPAPVDGAPFATASFASDLYHRAYVRAELAPDVTARQDTYELVAELAVRDRVHPARIHRTGHATARVRQDINDGALEVVLEAPPSWWLDLDGAVLTVERIAVREAKEGDGSPDVVFSCEGRLPDAEALARLRSIAAASPEIAHLAAARGPSCETEPLAIAMALEACERGNDDPHLLLWLGRRLLANGEIEQAAQTMSRGVSRARFLPKGLRGALAEAWLELSEREGGAVDERPLRDWSLDLAMRELMLSDKDPDAGEAVRALLRRLFADPQPTAFSEVLVDMRQLAPAEASPPGEDRAAAAFRFEITASMLRAAIERSDPALVYPQQLLGESLTELAQTRDNDFAPAIACFETVLQRDASFLPALTALAKIALLRDDLAAAGELLRRAFALAPEHEFAHYVQDELRRRVDVRRSAMSGAAADALRAGDDQRVRALADDYLRIDPSCDDAHYLRGAAGYGLGELRSAQRDLTASLSLGSDIVMRVVMLGQVQLELGEMVDAHETLSLALGCAEHSVKQEDLTGPTTAYVPYSEAKDRGFARAARAAVAAHLGQHDAARTEAARALVDCSTVGLALLDLAEVWRLEGDLPQARRLAEQALAADEMPLPPHLARQARRFLQGEAPELLLSRP